jgi:hypothetical protein
MRKARWLATTLLISCGGGSGIDLNFRGNWSGTTTVTATGVAPVDYHNDVTVLSDANSAILDGLCPGTNGGQVIPKGSGDTLTWATPPPPQCATTQFGTCSTVTFMLGSGTLTLSKDGATLTNTGTATAVGCGASTAVNFVFVGTK